MAKKKILDVSATVKKLLLSSSRYRNSDQRLVNRIWYEQLKKTEKNPDKMTATEFLKELLDGNLTSSDCITRARRKLNEKHEETRGTSYKPSVRKQAAIVAEINEIE